MADIMRKFNKDTYKLVLDAELHSGGSTKGEAQKVARMIRFSGNRARVVQSRNKAGELKWFVYGRRAD